MQLELDPDLGRRLDSAARRRSVSVPELVESVLTDFLKAQAPEDEPSAWVRATAAGLPRAWEAEDFTDWCPPDAT